MGERRDTVEVDLAEMDLLGPHAATINESGTTSAK